MQNSTRVRVINKTHYAGNTYKVLTHSRSAVSALQAEARSDSVRQGGLLGLRGLHLATPTALKPKSQEIHHARKPVLGLGSESVT